MVDLPEEDQQTIKTSGYLDIPINEDVSLAGWYIVPTTTRDLTPLARAKLKRIYEAGLWELGLYDHE